MEVFRLSRGITVVFNHNVINLYVTANKSTITTFTCQATRPRTLHNKTSSCRGGQRIGSFRALTQQNMFRTRPLVIHIW